MTSGPHTVSDVMTADVVSVRKDAPFKEIVRIARPHRLDDMVTAARLVRSVEGVVGVRWDLDRPSPPLTADPGR